MIPKRVYFIAVAGTGMSALAGLFKSRGAAVSGSDLACYSPVKEILEGMGVVPDIGYNLEHLKEFDPDFVVIGNFVRRDNPQAQYVMENGIEFSSFPGALEKFFLQDTHNFVVAGTHGKSTTSCALAHILNDLGKDPSYLIGALPFNLPNSFHVGAGEAFVLEGDEYDTAFFDKESKFLHYRPRSVIWTSLEFDHADIFPNMQKLESMFRKLIRLIPEEGHLLYCTDYPRIKQILEEEANLIKVKQVESYGFDASSDNQIEDYSESDGHVQFAVQGQKFRSSMAGRFNALNLVAASLAAKAYGLDEKAVAKSVLQFKGLKRRQELLFEKAGRRVFDDFAHHPTAVKLVTQAMKARFPNERLIVVFEARSNTTRRAFFQKDFVEAFVEADETVLAEVFKTESLEASDRLDIHQLVKDLRARSAVAEGPLTGDQLLNYLDHRLKAGPANVLILSNGSFDGLHEKLISRLEAHSFSL